MTAPTFPLSYRAVELQTYNTNPVRAMLGLRVVNKSITHIASNHLLIKMQASPCNPSDIAFMQGGYNIHKTLPCVPGFEGTGIVVAVGAGIHADDWVGKRISCFAQDDSDGTWAEYLIAKPEQLIPVDDNLTIDQAACFFINPFTAYALFEIALQNNYQALVINAAGSRVADFMFTLAKQHKMKTLGIVRRQQTMETLRQKGFDHVLLSTGEFFAENLKAALKQFDSCVAFDAVGGEQTGLIANCLPENSKIIVYGGLSGNAVTGINPMQLIFRKLSISGFNLNDWMNSVDDEKFNTVKNQLAALLKSGEVQVPINIQVSIDEIVKGMRTYLGAMSEGKMLIRF